MKLILLSFLTFSSLFAKTYTVDLFCQDINVAIQKVNVHAQNIANVNTTRTAEGGEYKRLLVKNCKNGRCELVRDDAGPMLVYEPNHPDADKNGFVAYPNYSVQDEMAGLLRAQNAYELVVKAFGADAIDYLVGSQFEPCFKKYKYFAENFDFKKYLGR